MKLNLTSNLRYRVVAIDDDFHWLDRATDTPLTYKNGDEARWPTLDQAITAFIDGKLSAQVNEPLVGDSQQLY